MYWNLIFRSLIELSLEFSIVASVDLKVHNTSTWGYILSSGLSVASIAILLALIGFIRFWVKPNYHRAKELDLQKKIGSLYFGLNLKSKVDSLSYTEWFIARRMLYAASALFAQDQAWLQFQLIFNLSIFSMWLIGKVRPFESVNFLLIEFMNEIFFVIIVYHLVCFTNIVADARVRTDAGISCIVFTCLAIFVNFVIMVAGMAHSIVLHIKRHQAKKLAKKRMLQRQIEELAARLQNPNMNDLERKIVAVEVKAKQTSYLTSLRNGGMPKIHANAKPDLKLSNLNMGLA